MPVDLTASAAFLTTHARLLDRHRFAVLVNGDPPAGALAALAGYGNPDGGYGWGLEPDLRAPESQPGGALHAFEVFENIAPVTTPRAVALCDWLEDVCLPDGALPFAFPVERDWGTAPFWADADPATPSLHITAAVAAAAHRVARRQPAVDTHPWLAQVTGYCCTAIAAQDGPASAHELRYTLDFLDAVADVEPRAAALLDRLGALLPPSGTLAIEGGADGERFHALDIAPRPDRPVRRFLAEAVVAADLDRLAAGQHADGGWTVDFGAFSPAAALDWRGYATVSAVVVLIANGRLPPP